MLGVLDAPARGEHWTAEKGKGAWRNGARLACERPQCAGRSPRPADQLPSVDSDLVAVPKPNSIALRIAMVAAGEADLVATLRWGFEWDIAAAALIADRGRRDRDRRARPAARLQHRLRRRLRRARRRSRHPRGRRRANPRAGARGGVTAVGRAERGFRSGGLRHCPSLGVRRSIARLEARREAAPFLRVLSAASLRRLARAPPAVSGHRAAASPSDGRDARLRDRRIRG